MSSQAIALMAWRTIQPSACGSITQSGSYELTTNLRATGDCLRIDADFVSIDLKGFTIFGNGTGTGIANANGSKRREVAISNWVVSNFEYGIALEANNHVVENMRVVSNRQTGARSRNHRPAFSGRDAYSRVDSGFSRIE
jgi:hypothetical protein